MDNRLNYHTTLNTKPSTPDVSKIIDKLNYHTSLQGSSIAMENLNKLNPNLDKNNIIALAYLATNPYIPEEDREEYDKKMKEKAQSEYTMYSKYINDLIRRNENCSSNESECNN